jgi:hypothetical protein
MIAEIKSRAGIPGLFAAWFFLMLPALWSPGCGGDIEPDEGYFDRYDACERMVTLCRQDRARLAPCVSWVEQNYPNRADRILLVQCMQDAPDCTSMTAQCNLEGLNP